MPRLRLFTTLFVLGAVLVGLALYLEGRRGPTGEDFDLSEMPFLRVPLQALQDDAGITTVFTVPDSPQWKRITSAWGDPGFMVFAAPEPRSVYRFDQLDLAVTVTVGGRVVPVESVVFIPYMRNRVGVQGGAVENRPGMPHTGVVFRAEPGADVTLHIVARSPRSLPQGELIVKREWSGAQKDHMIAPPVESLVAIPKMLGLGFFFLAAGLAALREWRKRNG
jgi:hypothetical protein